MARPLTLMSAAVLTAVASGILPYVLPVNDGRTPPTPPAISGAPLPSSLTPSGGPPPPSNIAPTTSPAAGGSTLVLSPSAVTVINQSQSKVVNLDNTPIVFERKEKTFVSNLLLRNSSGWQQQVRIDPAVLRDRNGTPLTAKIESLKSEGSQIEPFAVVNQRLDITVMPASGGPLLLPASGWLRLLATPKNPNAVPAVAKDSKSNQEPADPGYLYLSIVINEPKLEGLSVVKGVFFASLSIAGLIVVITAIILLIKKISLFRPMGGASWSFEQSWGANVTIGAAILTTFLTTLAFPVHPHVMEKTSYSLLQIMFTALIALAPLVYGLIRKSVAVNSNGVVAVDTRGYVVMFLLAGGLVLWGAFGQVFTLGVLIEEFILSGNLARSLGRATQGLAIILALLLIVYGLQSLYRTAKDLSKDPDEHQPKPSFRSGTSLTESEQTRLKRPMPEWPLL